MPTSDESSCYVYIQLPNSRDVRFEWERAEQGYLRHRMVSALTELRVDEDPRVGPNERKT